MVKAIKFESKHPFWGQRTATLDWCEENYLVNEYIAEFINTTTNLTFFCLCFFGIYTTVKYGLEKRFILAYAGILLVGIGSWCFHMTLLYQFQLLDELPMIYGTCILMHNIFETGPKRKYGLYLPLALITYAISITIMYLYVVIPIFHQITYAMLVTVLNFRSYYIVDKLPKDSQLRTSMQSLLFKSWTIFGLGFLAWNFDNIACDYLRSARQKVGRPTSYLLEFHGWWHIFTAIGTHYWIVFNQYVRLILLGEANNWDIKWTIGFIPYVARSLENNVKVNRKKIK
ncbi:alkaline ceramidase [Gigaspora rosea]|uniref:Alkaline ceramidase n=1 Tax=Gigaspora rosea TaxID=44941 RepID=A0A397U032_9GLOM|nr:alkaline ceramidase [Gigaspora rosea]